MVKNLGIKPQPSDATNVTVANGDKLRCDQVIKDFTWEMAGKVFEADMLVLPVGGYDVILGVEWMRRVSHVVFDFNNSSISVLWQQRRVELKQEQSQKAIRISLDAQKGNSITKGDTCFLIQVRSV